MTNGMIELLPLEDKPSDVELTHEGRGGAATHAGRLDLHDSDMLLGRIDAFVKRTEEIPVQDLAIARKRKPR